MALLDTSEWAVFPEWVSDWCAREDPRTGNLILACRHHPAHTVTATYTALRDLTDKDFVGRFLEDHPCPWCRADEVTSRLLGILTWTIHLPLPPGGES